MKTYNEILQAVTDLCNDIQESKNADPTVKAHKWQPLVNAANNLNLIVKAAKATQKPTPKSQPTPLVAQPEPEAEEDLTRGLLATSNDKPTRKSKKNADNRN